MCTLIARLILSLLYTIGIECLLGIFVFDLRTNDQIFTVVLAQVITNPLVNLFSQLAFMRLAMPLPAFAVVIALELTAVVVEALFYRYSKLMEHPWLISAVLNVASFTLSYVVR